MFHSPIDNAPYHATILSSALWWRINRILTRSSSGEAENRTMPILFVDNGFRHELPGLGKNTPFGELSEKRVTKAVRECLRRYYGHTAVEVSCDAHMSSGAWEGQCEINGREYRYRIQERATHNGGRPAEATEVNPSDAQAADHPDAWAAVDAIYARLAASGRVFSDSADLLREDRDR